MTTLKDINFGVNQYCGPAVLSALTGESTDRCAAVISAVSGQREIKAVNRAHLKQALKRLRFEVLDTTFGSSTLYGTLFRMRLHTGLYVVFVPKHVVAVEVIDTQIFICDNHSKTPLDIKQSARLTQRVEEVWQVIPKLPPKLLSSQVKLDNAVGRIDIMMYNYYEDSTDDNKYSMGYIRYKDGTELTKVMRALADEFGYESRSKK